MCLTFATFAIGLAARPLGGIIFGYLADRYSRKQSMTFTMLFMSIPTMCIGLLPTYSQIGIAAPLILIILRICQGIALGGEFGASCTYLYESVPLHRRGFFGTLALTGVGMGLILSSFTTFITESLCSPETIQSYAWRIPFFISVSGSLIALYARKNLLETEDFITIKNNNALVRNPFFEMFSNHKATLLKLVAIFLTTQVAFFVVFIYGKTMMIDSLGFDSYTAGKFTLITVVSYTVTTLIIGYLTDIINKRYIILFGVIGLLACAYPFISSLMSGPQNSILMLCILMGMFIGITEGTLNPLVAESFPTNIRATSVSFCWNFTAVAFGGVAPIVSMWLINMTGNITAVAYYLIGVCSISLVSLVYTLMTNKKEAYFLSVHARKYLMPQAETEETVKLKG